MKTNLLRFAPRFAATCAASFALVGAFAAPLTETTAVHTKPDIMAPVITVLKAGSEPVAAANSLANTPAGWMAVSCLDRSKATSKTKTSPRAST